jgi:UDP-glucose 4-epimerase
MDIVITGASGLIGALAVQHLSQRHRVYALVRHKPVAPVPNVVWLVADLTRERDLAVLPEQADVVIHLAQSRHFRDFPAAAMEMFQVNVASTMHLLEYARQVGARQFLYASSGGLYGSGPRPFTETDVLPPRDQLNFYLTTKLVTENLVQQYATLLVTTILRPFFVYGPGQHPQMLIPRLLQHVRKGQAIRLGSATGIRLNPIDVLDVVAILEHCLSLHTSCLMNVAGSEILTMRQIGEILGEAVGHTPRFAMTSDTAGDLLGDIQHLQQLLGYQPRVSFRDGIARLCAQWPG